MTLFETFKDVVKEGMPGKSEFRTKNPELFEEICNEFGSWDRFIFEFTHNKVEVVEKVVEVKKPAAAPKTADAKPTGAKRGTTKTTKS